MDYPLRSYIFIMRSYTKSTNPALLTFLNFRRLEISTKMLTAPPQELHLGSSLGASVSPCPRSVDFVTLDILQRQRSDAHPNAHHGRSDSRAGANPRRRSRHARRLQHGRDTGSAESMSRGSDRALSPAIQRLRRTFIY